MIPSTAGPPVFVISPHYDDGVLSLGGLLAGLGARATLVTVFGGAPAGPREPSAWDLRCGFADPARAARARALEDERACRLLGVARIALPLPDNPYEEPGATLDELSAFLGSGSVPGATVLVCAGIGNEDHARVRAAVLHRRRTAAETLLYADLPYAASHPAWGTPEAGALVAAGLLAADPGARATTWCPRGCWARHWSSGGHGPTCRRRCGSR
ncbi:PIG-L family deacetylase [Kitasatospora sp. NPDC050463]|uniref:PIG-L family deacetylase n=1 Tax=Kitasatospora sp. NPDC050463 TaxID=3155786 RepID=UPI0033EE9E47